MDSFATEHNAVDDLLQFFKDDVSFVRANNGWCVILRMFIACNMYDDEV